MASYKKHIAKDGKVTYYIRAFDGYNEMGEQIVRSMTWRPPEGLTQKQIEKELQKQIITFEQNVVRGTCFDSKTRFSEYATTWLNNNKPPLLAPKTYQRYEAMLKNINTAIGDIRLIQLQSHHLQEFYNNLRENGIKKVGSYAVSDNLQTILKQRNLSHQAVADISGISATTVSTACRSKHISIDSAQKIADALEMPVKKLFKLKKDTNGLSSKTILHHHRLIGVILTQAVRDRLIPQNVADRNSMKAPRLEHKEAVFLDDKQAREVLSLLDKEDIKWKTAMYLLIFSGIRRGELMGLEWQDIDFGNRVIHIRRTSQYVQHMGIITKSPKNETSIRTIKLSEMMFEILREYQQYWRNRRADLGDAWKDYIEITCVDNTKKIVRNDRLFNKTDSTPMNPDSITQWTREFIKKNNLAHFTPHSLRHTHATLLIAEGVSIPTVSHRLGHSSITTTSKIYAHAIQSADEIASDIIDDKLAPRKEDDEKKFPKAE